MAHFAFLSCLVLCVASRAERLKSGQKGNFGQIPLLRAPDMNIKHSQTNIQSSLNANHMSQ